MFGLSSKSARKTKRKKARKPRATTALGAAQRRFAAELGLDYDAAADAGKGAIFERFAAFQTLRRFHAPDVEPQALGDPQKTTPNAPLDRLILLIGGQIIDNADQIDASLDLASDGLKAEIVAIRATRANRFEPQAIANFAASLEASMLAAAGAEHSRAAPAAPAGVGLIHALRERAGQLGVRLKFSLFGYYAALGVWSEERDGAPALAAGRRALGQIEWLADAELEAVDKARLLDMMASGAPVPLIGAAGEREDAISVEEYDAELPLAGLVALPGIPGVSAGYSGHVPAPAFLALLERPDGQGLREAIFHQNVRGYQGDGGVNERIRATLAGPDRAQFLLRNNGVTIVADAIEPEGGAVTLVNYQIVNGLQTSTVIYRLRDEIRDASDVHVPVKLVAAQDWPLRRAIIEATNRQTPITGAALYAACEKAVEIERYFKLRAAAGGPPIYLERRPGQYPPDFPHQRISLEDLLRAFYAVFREKPQTSEKGFSAIAGEVDDSLLGPSLTPEPYYAAARLLSLAREAARLKDEPRLNQIEHHAAFALRVMVAPDTPPLGDAVAMRALCAQIERQIGGPARREELSGLLLKVTESPRERLRGGVQGVPTLKRTKESVERRARAATLSDAA